MQMDLPAIFSSTLGLSLPCPNCGCGGVPCQKKNETWYHDDFFRYKTYLHADVPHIECCGNIIPVERPWSREGSKFALLPGSKKDNLYKN